MDDPGNLSDELEHQADDFEVESDQSQWGEEEDDSEGEGWDIDYDDSTSPEMCSSPDDNDDSDIIPGVILEEVIEALDEKNRRAYSQKSLKDLCVDCIMDNKHFYVEFEETRGGYTLFQQLPECLLRLLREALFQREKNADMLSCSLFCSLINTSTTTSVRFRGCKRTLRQDIYDQEINFWRRVQSSSKLKQLSYTSMYQPAKILGLFFRLETLQIIEIPELLCDDGHLDFIATKFPVLQELTVSLKQTDISVKGAEALSRLKHFRKFIFEMVLFSVENYESLDFMASCLRLMPSLRRLGTATQLKPDCTLWDCFHPLHLLEQPAELALEALVLPEHCSLPETTTLPNLHELYLKMPNEETARAIGRFEKLTYLHVTLTQGNFESVEMILKVVGPKLKKLSLKDENRREICLNSVLALCPKVETLVVWAHLKKQSPHSHLKSELNLTELELHVQGLFFENSVLTDIFLRSNSTLRILNLTCVYLSLQDASNLAHFVSQQLIFKNLEEIVFNAELSEAILILLAQCAVHCHKLRIIKVPRGEDLDDSFKRNVAHARKIHEMPQVLGGNWL